MSKPYFWWLNILSKLPVFFQRLRAEVRALKVIETKTATKNALYRDHFVTEDNLEPNNDKKDPALAISADP